jgi:hypothetical protein
MSACSSNILRRLSLVCCAMALGLIGSGCVDIARTGFPAIPVADPSRAEPVTAGMQADRSVLSAGETFRILVRLRIAGGHYIYSTNTPHGPFTPLTLKVVLPAGLEPAGDWMAPRPTVTKAGEEIYTDSALLWRRVRVRLNAPTGSLSIKGELRCQACAEDVCWPAAEIPLAVTVQVISKKAK